MDIKKRKKELEQKFDLLNKQIVRLAQEKERLRGKYQLLEELKKENADSKNK